MQFIDSADAVIMYHMPLGKSAYPFCHPGTVKNILEGRVGLCSHPDLVFLILPILALEITGNFFRPVISSSLSSIKLEPGSCILMDWDYEEGKNGQDGLPSGKAAGGFFIAQP